MLLIRHGETDSNKHHILDAQYPGPSLNETGFEQADALVERLSAEPIEAIYSSDITRAVQTAQPLATALTMSIHQLSGLREITAGIEQGSHDYRAYVNAIHAWRDDLDSRLQGAESGREFFTRYDQAISRICSGGYSCVAVFSHASAIRTWTITRVTNLSWDDEPGRLFNTSIVELEGDMDTGWRCIRWADETID